MHYYYMHKTVYIVLEAIPLSFHLPCIKIQFVAMHEF